MAERFSMLQYSLAVALIFSGIKTLIVEFYPIPIAVSFGVVGGILAVTLFINARVNCKNDRSCQPNNLLKEVPVIPFLFHIIQALPRHIVLSR